MSQTILVTVLAALVLAGCFGTPAAPRHGASLGSTQAPVAPAAQDLGRGTGAIEGDVVDTELMPIEGVAVQIVPPGSLAAFIVGDRAPSGLVAGSAIVVLRSDSEGRFSVRGLEPGTYLAYGSKTGYQDAAPQHVEVMEATTSHVQMVLTPTAPAEPYHLSIAFKTLVNWLAVHSPVFSSGGIYYTDSKNRVTGETGYRSAMDFSNNETDSTLMQTMVVEMKWTPNSAVCAAGMVSEVYSPEEPAAQRYGLDADPYHWSNGANTSSPTKLTIPRDGADPAAMHSANRTERNHGRPIETVGNWYVEFHGGFRPTLGGPVDYSCSFQQRVDGWLNAFYLDPAPADWSIYGDG
jgi:hypothetical protein